MTTSAAITTKPTPRTGRLTPIATVSILTAAAVNLAMYAVGRAASATLMLDPAVGTPNHLVTAFDVAWKTILPLAFGTFVLALVARRSRRWTTIVTAAGAVVAIPSGIFPFLGAHDTLTGVLLLGMHTTTGLAIILIGARARANAPT